MRSGVLDPETAHAARVFLERAGRRYDLVEAWMFGSRARREHRPDSDADIAVLLRGVPGARLDTALAMADIAFDVLLETGILVEPVPFWEEEWRHLEGFDNPALIENIRREGIPI
jgi:predicted nucleotidyltransferase